MTISSTTNRVVYTGNAVTTAFSFPYAFFAQADLIVVSTLIATGAQTTQALTTNYTISGSTDSLGHYSSGGTVTALVAPAATVTWTIYRDPTATQTTDLVANDALPAEALEAAFDYQTMLNQRTRDIASRAIQQPEGDSATIGRLPSVVDRAGKHLTFDVNGDPGVSALTQTGTGLVYVMQTSPTLITPLLGTPTSGVLTNCTGTASGLTAGNVTTNANLTGPITSVGNATAVNAQTGTGSTFVMQTSPTLTTPDLGTPSAGVLTSCTGTASGLTAGNVTTNANLTGGVTSVGNAATVVTNANLTGHVTSVGNAAVLGSFTSAQLAAALTNETGSGSAVFATSPVLTTPDLGTPSALVGTNITGTATAFTASNVTTNANLTGHVTSVGNAAVLGSFTSAQLATALTDETGSGAAVFAVSPNLTTPVLGTPTSGTLTNCTGLPVAGGGTGSATAAAAKIALAVVSSATGSEIIPAGTTAERDAAPATGYLRFNTTNTAFEGYTGAAWSSIGGGGAALSNDTATATDIYPLFAAATTGTPTNIYTSNAKLLYKPSTGEFKANAPVALNGLMINATAIATSYTIATGYNASSVGPVTIGGGVVITISSGQRWLVL